MSRRGPLGVVLALATLAAPAPARADVEHGYQSWLMVVVQGRLSYPVWLQSDVQYRGYPNFTPAAILVRPGLGFRVGDGLMLTFGYAWTPSFRAPDAIGYTDEHRAWEQFTWDYEHARSGVRFQSRTRLEQRFRYPADVEVGVRLREFVRVSVPIVPGPRPLTFVAWDEVFFAFNDSGGAPTATGSTTPRWQTTVFDQNRAFVGLGYQVVPVVLRLELGYLNQLIRRATHPAGDLMNHEVLLAAFLSWK